MRQAMLALGFFGALSAPCSGEAQNFPSLSIDDEILAATIRLADAKLELRSRPHPKLGDEWRLPELKVEWRGEEAGTLTVQEGASSHVPATGGVVEMDPANDTPEFVLISYTGGAHCCTEVSVLSKSLTGPWQSVPMGAFDGGPPLQDIDGDGRFEIVAKDDPFSYAFGCYACSVAPLKILTVQGGSLRDSTFEPRYLPAHRAYLEKVEEGVDLRKAGNAFLAGWVAEKIIVGEGAKAWAEMLLSYDRDDEWGLMTCPEGGGECEDSEKVRAVFPEALRAFLNERGYPL